MEIVTHHASKPERPALPGGEYPDGILRLARYSHIFGSVVREVLEIQLLREISPKPLSISQFHLLKLITLNGSHQVGEAADFLGVSAPAATKNIEKLVQLGLLTRRPSRTDRRVQLLGASRSGRGLVRRYETRKSARLREVVRGFRPEEIEQLTNLLERFSVALYKADNSSDGWCMRCAAHVAEDCAIGRARGGCPYQRFRQDRPIDGTRDQAPQQPVVKM